MKARWPKRRDEIRKHLRRSPELTDGAFRLWDELAAGWAWTDPVCFPTLSVLAKAMGKHRNTISKHLDELVDAGLVVRERWRRGYKFTLVEEIPTKFLDAHLDNKGLRKDRRKSKSSDAEPPTDMHKNVCMTSQNPASSCTDPRSEYAHERVHVVEEHAQGLVHEYAHVRVHVDEDEKGEEEKPELKQGKGEVRELEVRASEATGGTMRSPSRCALGDEGIDPNGETMTYSEDNELEGLIEEPFGDPSPKFKPKNKAADPALVSGVGRGGTPFPEAQGASQSDDLQKSDPGLPSPHITRPEDVLALLRDEVREKWGPRATRQFPFQLAPKGKLTRQIESALLRQYTPDVLRDMIRLLVWDWEVARGVCFPFRHDAPYPDLLSLVQYHKELAARIDTGFSYPSSKRGASNTYKDLYIDRLERVADDDPF